MNNNCLHIKVADLTAATQMFYLMTSPSDTDPETCSMSHPKKERIYEKETNQDD